jgi:PhnB protein
MLKQSANAVKKPPIDATPRSNHLCKKIISMPTPTEPTFFAPHLNLRNVQAGIEFYQNAFNAIELRRWTNPDGTVHVAEMSIGGALFHLHEEVPARGQLSPETVKATTNLVGLFLPDPATTMTQAIAAGGRQIHPVTDYDYGYRQGLLADPAGHLWILQKKI